MWQWPTVESIAADVRLAVRQLRKSPGFTIAAVLTLALAIGANAVVFGLLEGMVLRPLNVPQSETLYGTHYGDDPAWQSYPNYIDLRDRNRSFEDLAAFNMVRKWSSIRARIRLPQMVSQRQGITSTCCAFNPISAVSFTHLTSAAPIALRMSCSPTRTGQPGSTAIRASWAVVFSLIFTPFTSSAWRRLRFQGTIMFIAPDFFMPIVNEEQKWARRA